MGIREKYRLVFSICVIIFSMIVFLGSGIMESYGYTADNVPELKVQVNGKYVEFYDDIGKPFIDANERTLVPLRAVAESIGCIVIWDNDNRIVKVQMGGTVVLVPIDNKYILVNGNRVENDTEAVIVNGRTYLPIRAVLEAFGAVVGWENETRTVVANISGNIHPNESANSQSGSNSGKIWGSGKESTALKGEMHGVWISYLEYMSMPKDEAGFKASVDKMFDRCKEVGMNAVIVQVRSHSDAMYQSAYYPWSIFATGTQGKNPMYDPMAYMIDAAHKRNMEFHAWINPYRVTGYGCYWDQTTADNLVYKWQNDGDPSNDRWALLHKKEYYMNPAIPEVRQLIVNGVKEIVANYDVDGIHFDDYFYPVVNDGSEDSWFDLPEYRASGTSLEAYQWRRENVNMLVKDVYASIKELDRNCVFGISPAGNLSNLRSRSKYFTDIDRWFKEEGYVDYIMPQLYWGFEARTGGQIAPYAYENNLKQWVKLANTGDTKLLIGLDMANAGTKVPDGNLTSEWLRYSDIIARQVVAARNTGNVKGFAYFRYSFFNAPQAQGEVKNLEKVIK